MRKLRKSFMVLTTQFSFLTALLALGCVLYMAFQKQSIAADFVNAYASTMQELNLAVSTIMNVTMVYFITSMVANLLFGVVYVKFSKTTYPMFYENKNGLWFLFALQLFVGLPFLASACLLVVLLVPPSKTEKQQLQQHLDEKHQLMRYKIFVGNDPKLLSMSLQIDIMKRLLKAKQIDYDYYMKKINEIITNGVQR